MLRVRPGVRHRPPSSERIYWFATRNVPEGQDDSPSRRKQALLKPFYGWYPAIPALIQATPEDALLHNDIYNHPPLAAWSKGRVTLLGDAAHPSHARGRLLQEYKPVGPPQD